MKMKKSIVLIACCLSSLCFAQENQSITFSLPQAVIANPELCSDYPALELNSEAIYSFDFLFQEDAHKWITTKIGSLGFMTASITKESRTIGISYLSLPKRMPECEIFLPKAISDDQVNGYALEMIILPSKKGPNSLDIQIGLGEDNYSKTLNAKLEGPTLILIPLTLFEINNTASIKSIRIFIPKGGDSDGIGSYSIKDPRIVIKK